MGPSIKDAYSKLIIKSGKDALFDSKTTHVGIACGCHTEYTDYCCFAYGTNVNDKSGVKSYGEINVDKMTCSQS